MNITFIFPKGTKAPYAKTNTQARAVYATSLKALKKTIGFKTDAAFYQNVNTHGVDMGEGHYFAVKNIDEGKTSYGIVFIDANREIAHLTSRVKNVYKTVTHRMKLSVRNSDCYTINAKTEIKLEEVKPVQAKEETQEEIIARLMAENARLAAEKEQLAVANNQKDVVIDALRSKTAWHAKRTIKLDNEKRLMASMYKSGHDAPVLIQKAEQTSADLDAMEMGL